MNRKPALAIAMMALVAGCATATPEPTVEPTAKAAAPASEAAAPEATEPAAPTPAPEMVFASERGVGEDVTVTPATGDEPASWHRWKTRVVDPQELRVGQYIVVPSSIVHDERGALLTVPKTGNPPSWRLTMVVRKADERGEVIAANSYRIAAGAARLVEGDHGPIVADDGDRDRDCFAPDTLIVAQAAPLARSALGQAGALIEAPVDGVGTYLGFRDAAPVRSGYTWKSRPATRDDIKVGAIVFTTIVSKWSCEQLLTGNWIYREVTDVSKLDQGLVGVVAAAPQKLEQLRVPIP